MNELKEHTRQTLMERVLVVRHTDLTEEKDLCVQLLALAQASGDAYAEAFAYTYLADSAIGQNKSDDAWGHLQQAERLVKGEAEYNSLRLRLYNLLALYYELLSDDQASTQYYLAAVELARKMGDVVSEAMIHNNVGFAFQRHSNFETALHYYKKAYRLLENHAEASLHMTLLSNLVEVCLLLGQTQEAHSYLALCAKLQREPEKRDMYLARNRCYYYTVLGERQQAISLAEQSLKNPRHFSALRLSGFENSFLLCKCMMTLGHREYAMCFLRLMEECCVDGGVDYLQQYEEQRIAYYQRFGTPQEQDEAYCRYYQKSTQLRSLANQSVVQAMKAQIHLEESLQQNETLQSRQQALEQEINIDELTGLYNRRFFDSGVRARMVGYVGRSFGAIMLDVDYFKEYNDFYGHMQGDIALREVALCLQENCVPGITPCRFGGDEFACLCDGLDSAQLEAYVASVRHTLHQRALPHTASHCAGRLTLSIGYAVAQERVCGDPHTLLELADKALYEAKLRGRNACAGRQVEA